MTAQIIPGLNSSEIPQLLRAASENGASTVGYTMVRFGTRMKGEGNIALAINRLLRFQKQNISR
jgi:hypothetical protein